MSLTAASSGDLEVTVDFLTEVDKLVQLIECPIFTCKEETLRGEGLGMWCPPHPRHIPLPAPPSQAAAAAQINRAEVMRLLAGRFAQCWSCPLGWARGGQLTPPRYRLRERTELAPNNWMGGRTGGACATLSISGGTRVGWQLQGATCATSVGALWGHCGCCWRP